MANILTIAGSDPSGQAGIQVDMEVIRALGHRGLTVITAVTAQNDDRVYSVNPVDTKTLKDQLRAILSKYSIDAVKVGLLVTNQLAYQVYRILDELHVKNLVVDPIMQSSSGSVLLESAAVPVLTGFLLPMARLVTPNLDEAETLAGMPVKNVDHMCDAADKILNGSPGLESVLVKGGHLQEDRMDVLLYKNELQQIPAHSPISGNTRGTGCILSTAIACYLAEGMDLPEAVQRAKSFLEDFIDKR
jgi:hydroxymethylpyrimidine/phosphomethylpyrimidine kinase